MRWRREKEEREEEEGLEEGRGVGGGVKELRR